MVVSKYIYNLHFTHTHTHKTQVLCTTAVPSKQMWGQWGSSEGSDDCHGRSNEICISIRKKAAAAAVGGSDHSDLIPLIRQKGQMNKKSFDFFVLLTNECHGHSILCGMDGWNWNGSSRHTA